MPGAGGDTAGSNPKTRQGIAQLKETLESLVNNVKFKNIINEMVSDIMSEKMQALEKSMEECQGRILDLEAKVGKKDSEISRLRSSLQQEEERSKQLKTRCEEQEQYSRRNNLRIFGIAEKEGEVTDQEVIKVAKRLGVDLSVHDIDRSHRTGPRSKETTRGESGSKQKKVHPRPILVKFCSYRQRHNLIVVRKNLKKSGISIAEDLTKSKLELLKSAEKHPAVKQAWSSDGRIIASLHATSGNIVKKVITCQRDLELLPCLVSREKENT